MLRELDTREYDGLTVSLFWDSVSGDPVIGLQDRKTNTQEMFFVPRDSARDAFLHPYCYLYGKSK